MVDELDNIVLVESEYVELNEVRVGLYTIINVIDRSFGGGGPSKLLREHPF